MKQQLTSKSAIILFVIFMTQVSFSFAETITTTAQGGLWDSESTWVGGKLPQLTDNVVITSVVTTGNTSYSTRTFKMANLTVNAGGKILREADKGGRYSLEIHGNLVNNGEIIDYLDYFDIYLFGNMENNGVFKPRLVYLQGANQHISTTKPIECKTFNFNMTDNEAIASSNLQFKNCYLPANGTKTLNMGLYNLSLSADSVTYSTYYGEIYSKSEMRIPVKFEKTGILELDKSIIGKTITGNCILKSPSYAFLTDLTVEGNLTIAENTKVSSTENLIKLVVKGDFTNFSKLNKDSIHCGKVHAPVRSMNLFIYGNTLNLGTTGISKVFPITNGDTISVQGNFDGDVEIRQAENSTKPGGKVLIDSEVSIADDLYLYSNLEITESGILNMLTKTVYNPIYVGSGLGTITNNGNINRYHRVSNAWSNRTFANPPGMSINYELREWTGQIDGLDVSVFNGQTYPNLVGSVKRWWRITPIGSGKVTKYTLKLFYDEDWLNGQNETNLKVFQSNDNGENWKVISLGQYAKLDTVENSISIGDWSKAESMLSEFGDFVISSGDGTVPIPSPIIVDLVGSPNIRLGAPNRFTVHLHNVSNTEAEPFMAVLSVTDDIVFKQVEITNDTDKVIYPIDSIGSVSDHTQLFYIPYLDPYDDYSFDVIVMGVNPGTKSAQTETGITAAAIVGNAGHTISEEMAGTGQAVRPMDDNETKEYEMRLGLQGKKYKAEKSKIEPYRKVVAETLIEIFDKIPGTKIISKIGSVFEFLKDNATNIRQRVYLAIQRDLDPTCDKKKATVVSPKVVKGKIVAAKDPNEKMGPTGYGESNFITSAGNLNYTIAFENKKEATAPAYRVQIVDTLSAVFDPSTVKFGTTSHSGSQYNWKMERNGNILKWDIEGIELPPNVTPPEGEGYVSFSVDLKEGLGSGVPIENSATIVFDLNEPITTNTWVNVLDTIAPRTAMNPISFSAGDTILNISCNAIDNENGSGIGKHDFYVSVNNGPFAFIGESFGNFIPYIISDTTRNNYRFYALTADNVGNAEKSVPAYSELNSFLVSTDLISDFNNNIKIYPNPATDIITVDFLVENQSQAEFRLYSVTGKLITSSGIGQFKAGQHSFTVDISYLNEGVYFAEVRLNNRPGIYKLVKK